MARAVYYHIMMAPNKVRRIANLVRGKSVTEAQKILDTSALRAGKVVKQTLKSAAANAENNEGADRNALVITRIAVDEGVRLKRYLPRARGRADRIRKRTSHLTIEVRPQADASTARRAPAKGKA